MTANSQRKLYRLRVGDRVYENVSSGAIAKNILSGKLKKSHQTAAAGSENWVPLGEIPELMPYFRKIEAEQAEFDTYDIQKGSEELAAVPRPKLLDMIRKGELAATDRIMKRGDDAWMMAGDAPELIRYFDLRRKIMAERGSSSIRPEDTGTPFYIDLAAPFIYIGNLRFLFNMLAILAFFAIALFVPIPIVSGPLTFLATFYLYAYYFRVVSNAGNGGTKFPEFTESSDLVGEMIRPGIQFFLTRVMSVMPLILYMWFLKFGELEFWWKLPYVQIALTMPYILLLTPDFSTFETFLFMDPFIWIGLAIMILYQPISLMRQASYGEFLPTYNFPAVFISIARAIGPYMALVAYLLVIDIFGGIILVIVYIWMGLAMMAGPAGEGAAMLFPAPFQLLIQGIVITGTFLKMYFIGRYLFQNAERMGWD